MHLCEVHADAESQPVDGYHSDEKPDQQDCTTKNKIGPRMTLAVDKPGSCLKGHQGQDANWKRELEVTVE